MKSRKATDWCLPPLAARAAGVMIAACMVAAGASGVASAATPSTPRLSGMVSATIKLANLAGFAHISRDQLATHAPIETFALTPEMAINLGAPRSDSLVVRAAGIAITNSGPPDTVTIFKETESDSGFGIVTERHAHVEYRYHAILAPGTTIKTGPDGGLFQVASNGRVIGYISPAYAVDSVGAHLPASYTFDSRDHVLIVKANTTHAKGAVFIDPSWHCWATATLYGAAWIVAVAAWVFTDGTAAWVAWALRVWFGLQLNAANAIARACT